MAMSENTSQSDCERRIDAICDEFERQLLTGRRPCIDDFLRQVSPAERPDLSVELLRVAVEYSGPNLRRRDPSATNSAAGPQCATETQPLSGAPIAASTVDPTATLQRMGDYELLEEIGSGGMGAVYRARQISVGRTVALKIIRPDRWKGLSVDQRSRAVERFINESQAAARREHPNILAIYDAGQQDGVYFLAMQLVNGRSLAAQVANGPLEDRRSAAYLEPVCRALHGVHQAGIVHRDLKPSNILVDSTSDWPWVSDFGLAKVFDSEQELTLSGDLFGTPSYMSPEQVLNAGQVTVGTDVYGIGATLYHMLTGRPPFQATTVPGIVHQVLTTEPVAPRLLNPAVSRDMETITLKCLEKEPRRRYSSALAVARDLQHYLAGQPIEARPLGWFEIAIRWCRRHQAVAALLAVLLTTLVTAVIVVSILYSRERLARRVADDSQKRANALLARSYEQASKIEDPAARTNALPLLLAAHELNQGTDRELASRLRLGRALAACPRLSGFIVHNSRISDVTFSKDGQRIVTASDDGQVCIRDVTGVAEPLITLGHPAAVSGVALSPIGSALAVACRNGTVYLYSLEDLGAAPKQLSHSGPAKVAFSSYEELFATVAGDNTVRIWNASTADPIGKPMPHDVPVLCCQFSPNGNLLTTGCTNGRAYIWSLATGERLAASPKFAGAIRTATFHPKDEKILVAAAAGTAFMYDLNLQSPCALSETHDGPLLNATFDQEGDHALLVTRLGPLRLVSCSDVDVATTEIAADSRTGVVAFSRNGRLIAAATTDRALEVWEVGSLPRKVASLSDNELSHLVQFDPTSRWLLSAAGQVARIWSMEPADRALNLESGPISVALCSRDGQTLVTSSTDRQISSYRMENEAISMSGGKATAIPAVKVGLAANGESWAWGNRDGQVRVASSATGQVIEIDATQYAPIGALALDREGQQIAISGENADAVVFDVTDPAMPKARFELGFGSRTLAFDSTGSRLLVVGAQQAVLAPVQSPSNASLLSQGPVILGVAWDAEQRYAVIGRADRTLQGFDLTTGMPTTSPLPVDGAGLALLICTENRIAGATSDGTVHFWDARTGSNWGTSLKHSRSIVAMCFCHTDDILATLCDDGALRVWDAAAGELIAYAHPRASRPVSCHFLGQRQEILAVFVDGYAVASRHPLDDRSIDQLRSDAGLYSGHRLDEHGNVVAISASELIHNWTLKQPSHP